MAPTEGEPIHASALLQIAEMAARCRETAAQLIERSALRERDRCVKLLQRLAADHHQAAVCRDAVGDVPAALTQTAVTQALRRAAEAIRQGE